MEGETPEPGAVDEEVADRPTPEDATPTTSVTGDDEPKVDRQQAERRLGSTVSGFRLTELLGRGGAASVYRAIHEDGRAAAIKVLHPEHTVDTRARKRLLREAYVANRIGHPGVARVRGHGVTEDGAAYLILELCEGETLQARKDAAAGAGLAVEDVARWMDELLDVLAVAHDREIVHRDIKPANLLATRDGRLKVLDFGIARTMAAPEELSLVTRTGAVLGTPYFMPPEQARGCAEDIDARSDLWSVGATMFTLLTGRYVHPARNVNEAIVFTATQKAPRGRSVRTDLPVAVAEVVDRALSFDRQGRFVSAREMQDALRKAMRGETSALVKTTSLATLPEESTRAPVRSDAGDDENAPPKRSRAGIWWAGLGAAAVLVAGVNLAASIGAWLSVGVPADPAAGSVEDARARAGVSYEAAVSAARSRLSITPADDAHESKAGQPPQPNGAHESKAGPAKPIPRGPLRSVFIGIEPPDAAVVVDGTRAELDNGVLEVRGKPGTTHVVRVSQGRAVIVEKVQIPIDYIRIELLYGKSPPLLDFRPVKLPPIKLASSRVNEPSPGKQ